MASDKQRPEVVKRLRNGGIARNSKEAYVLLLRCVGIRPQLPATSTYKYAMVRIADLIDRPTCHLVENEDGYTACSECGCTALCMLDAVFCPDCGARVIHKEETNDQ